MRRRRGQGAQAWKPGSQHAGEKRGVAGLLLGRPTPVLMYSLPTQTICPIPLPAEEEEEGDALSSGVLQVPRTIAC